MTATINNALPSSLTAEFVGDAAFDVLNDLRRLAIHEREYWASLKRTAGKFAKEEERFWLRRYRAVCLLIGIRFAPEDLGDCPHRPVRGGQDHTPQWPGELQEGLDWATATGLVRLWGSL